jgi:hypothetical protein
MLRFEGDLVHESRDQDLECALREPFNYFVMIRSCFVGLFVRNLSICLANVGSVDVGLRRAASFATLLDSLQEHENPRKLSNPRNPENPRDS